MALFLSFCDGSFKDSAHRIESQAKETELFTEVKVLSFSSNEKYLIDFYKQNQNFYQKNSRGLGFWSWKPLIVDKELSKLAIGDVMFYADCGCELSKYGNYMMTKLLRNAKKNGSLIFQMPYYENEYNRFDLYERYLKKVMILVIFIHLKFKLHSSY